MKEKKIMWICSSSVCALCVSAVCPVIVVLQPNLQDMLTIAQRTCALNFVLLSTPLLLFGCFNEHNLC